MNQDYTMTSMELPNSVMNKPFHSSMSAQAQSKLAAGRWTKEEHQRFVEAIKNYGKNWKKVEDFVGTRNGAQIRSHAQKFFLRLEKEYKNKHESHNEDGRGESKKSIRKASDCSISTYHTQPDNLSDFERPEESLRDNLPLEQVLEKINEESKQTITTPTEQKLEQEATIIPTTATVTTTDVENNNNTTTNNTAITDNIVDETTETLKDSTSDVHSQVDSSVEMQIEKSEEKSEEKSVEDTNLSKAQLLEKLRKSQDQLKEFDHLLKKVLTLYQAKTASDDIIEVPTTAATTTSTPTISVPQTTTSTRSTSPLINHLHPEHSVYVDLMEYFSQYSKKKQTVKLSDLVEIWSDKNQKKQGNTSRDLAEFDNLDDAAHYEIISGGKKVKQE